MKHRIISRDIIIDISFLVGVGLKLVNALTDILIGIPLLFISPTVITSVVQFLTGDELSEDPHDPIANFLVTSTAHVSAFSLNYAAVYLLIHGIVKVAILVALVRGSLKLYPWVIGALAALLIYQITDFVFTHSTLMAGLSLLDGVVLWLTWREWRHHRVLKDVLYKYAPRIASKWPFSPTIA